MFAYKNRLLKPSNVDIVKLAHSVAQDNRTAFSMFYQIYYEDVFRLSYYFLKEKEACGEVISDVFFSVWQSRKKLKEIANMEAYLYTVTRNESIRYLNKRKNYDTVSFEEIPIQLAGQDDASPEDTLENKEIEELLTRIINELPEKCRLIFLMTRQEGLKPKEIAEILSINESTVRVQMKIAVDKIITRIRPYFPNLTLTMLLMICLY